MEASVANFIGWYFIVIGLLNLAVHYNQDVGAFMDKIGENGQKAWKAAKAKVRSVQAQIFAEDEEVVEDLEDLEAGKNNRRAHEIGDGPLSTPTTVMVVLNEGAPV